MSMRERTHPGEILRLHMEKRISVGALAEHMGLSRNTLSMILNGRLGVSAATALKLSEAFPATQAEFWMNLQTQYDLSRERMKKRQRVRPVTAMAV